MSRLDEVTPVFVDNIPIVLEHGKLYLSCRYRAIIHLCACGCGVKISTPLHPTGWRLSYDGKNVSLSPSIGNWSEKCQSHYVIQNNRILWGERLPRDMIRRIREERHRELNDYYGGDETPTTPQASRPRVSQAKGFWAKVRNIIRLTKR